MQQIIDIPVNVLHNYADLLWGMNLTDLIEQLELIKQDHPHSASLDVRINDLDAFMVHLNQDEGGEFVEIECYRPYALGGL